MPYQALIVNQALIVILTRAEPNYLEILLSTPSAPLLRSSRI